MISLEEIPGGSDQRYWNMGDLARELVPAVFDQHYWNFGDISEGRITEMSDRHYWNAWDLTRELRARLRRDEASSNGVREATNRLLFLCFEADMMPVTKMTFFRRSFN